MKGKVMEYVRMRKQRLRDSSGGCSINRCERGLSALQKKILLLMFDKRGREGSDLPQHELLSGVAGWEPDRVPLLKNGRRYFSRAAIGARKYNKVHASVSRAVARLGKRGLVTVHTWCFHDRRELGLTVAGLEVARLLFAHRRKG